ncbi:MAG: MoxR family ATPase, partial [Pseudomonadota bacterium]
MNTLTQTEETIVPRLEAAAERVQLAQKEAAGVIFGQDEVINRAMITILAGGHALLIGVPGLAKTLLVDTLGTVLGLDAKRIQFTPDLMPSDIIGSEVLEESADQKRSFRFIKGPVFTQLLMADEINRASPKTQSALLQAMQEHHVTVAGERHDVPEPFHVLATQNPLEQEGTYPLPEAQLDRFLLQVDVDYPDLSAERRMLYATTGNDKKALQTVLSATEIQDIQQLVRQIPVPDKVVEAILTLVRSARPGTGANEETDKNVAWGPGPRASQAFMMAVRARALIDGRLAPSIDDVV